ncbi:hypothetical protein TNCV_863141 [Trichonephila clavipes]|nr:hypothetical protein TNCV_863141 [Trichonephila clavipes]
MRSINSVRCVSYCSSKAVEKAVRVLGGGLRAAKRRSTASQTYSMWLRDYTGMGVRLGSTDKVMFLRSNQGDRLDGNESVADSFRSDLVGFKSWSGRIFGAFSLLRLPEKTSIREANSLPEVTPQSLLFSSDKYHPCKI